MSKKGKIKIDPKVRDNADLDVDGGSPGEGWENMGSKGPKSEDIISEGKFAWAKGSYCFWINIGGTWYRICV